MCVFTQTKTLSVELLSYNPMLHVLGYLSIDLEWEACGDIEAVIKISGLPALDYLSANETKYSAFSKAGWWPSRLPQ